MKRPQDIGNEWEKKFAKKIGGKIQPGSGNQWYAKLDVSGKTFLWSLKATSKESFRLTRGMLHETIRAVIGPGGTGGNTMPGMAIQIQDEEYVVMLVSDFLELMREEITLFPPSPQDRKNLRSRIPKMQRGSEE